MPGPSLQIVVDGEEYTLRLGDITAVDARDFRAAVGMSITQVMHQSPEAFDIDQAAALVWLARRKHEPRLTFDQVAAGFTYQTSIDVADPDAGPADGSDPSLPEI